MITIEHLADKTILNEQIRLRLDMMDNSLYPITPWISYNMSIKNYSLLKNFASENLSSNLSASNYFTYDSSLTEEQRTAAADYLATLTSSDSLLFPYVYLGSKTQLRATFFSDYTPSAFSAFISHLVNKSCIKVIGSGHGSSILFYNDNLAFNLDPVVINSVSSFQSSISSFVDSYNQLQNDYKYLLDLLKIKEDQIASLSQEIQNLNYSIRINSINTWQ